MKKILNLCAVLTLAIFAFAGGAAAQNDAMKSDDKMMAGKKNPDAKFMMMAATSGMNEIALSQQALSKSSNEEIKQMAQQLIDDHTKASDELKTLAASKNVMLPAEPDAKHKAATEKMSSMSGAEFDMAYVKMLVKDHEKSVAMFQKEADKGKDAEAKAFAAKTLPTLQGHLDMARNLMNKMMGNKSNNNMSGM